MCHRLIGGAFTFRRCQQVRPLLEQLFSRPASSLIGFFAAELAARGPVDRACQGPVRSRRGREWTRGIFGMENAPRISAWDLNSRGYTRLADVLKAANAACQDRSGEARSAVADARLTGRGFFFKRFCGCPKASEGNGSTPLADASVSARRRAAVYNRLEKCG